MKKSLALAICCILPIIIIGFLLSRTNQKESSIVEQQATKTSTDSVAVGNPFPDFTVIEADGRTITLSYFSWIFSTIAIFLLLFFIWRMNGLKKL